MIETEFSFRLHVLGEDLAVFLAEKIILYEGFGFIYEPLPDDHHEFRFKEESSLAKAKRICDVRDTWTVGMGNRPTWELTIKPGVHWKLIARNAEEARAEMHDIIEGCDGEIEPMSEPFLPPDQWNPRLTPSAWIPN
jgi:hypothetical protein